MSRQSHGLSQELHVHGVKAQSRLRSWLVPIVSLWQTTKRRAGMSLSAECSGRPLTTPGPQPSRHAGYTQVITRSCMQQRLWAVLAIASHQPHGDAHVCDWRRASQRCTGSFRPGKYIFRTANPILNKSKLASSPVLPNRPAEALVRVTCKQRDAHLPSESGAKDLFLRTRQRRLVSVHGPSHREAARKRIVRVVRLVLMRSWDLRGRTRRLGAAYTAASTFPQHTHGTANAARSGRHACSAVAFQPRIAFPSEWCLLLRSD
jgi:hypothetical protein